jgi:hypothetical protein
MDIIIPGAAKFKNFGTIFPYNGFSIITGGSTIDGSIL